jgi:hypothetical protein
MREVHDARHKMHFCENFLDKFLVMQTAICMTARTVTIDSAP